MGRLILKLREWEGLYIGDDIELTVVKINNNVEVAISAPKSTLITRKKREENWDGEGNSDIYSTGRRG